MMFNAERKTFVVVVLTLITMAAEIFFGYYTKSMALLADGWHMGTHALALSITFCTYVLIRKFANTKTFVFGTGKFSTMAGFLSSLFLGGTGIFIIFESVERLLNPQNIGFNEAIIVAVVGLIVNTICMLIMGEQEHNHCHGHNHEHCHCQHDHKEHNHHEPHQHEDLNYKAAYLHIAADAMTSVFAIIALLAAKYAGVVFLDPIVGFAGGAIICKWAYGLVKQTGMILLDAESIHIKKQIREMLDKVVKTSELHVWQSSENKFCLIGRVYAPANINELKDVINSVANFDIINLEVIHTSEHQ